MRTRHFLVSLLIIAAALFLVFNLLIPLTYDDYLYTAIFQAGEKIPNCANKIESFGDVLLSQWHHYFAMNGRAIVHLLVQCFCGLWGKVWSDILAGALFAIFVFCLGKLSFPKQNTYAAGFVSLIGYILLSHNHIMWYYPGVASLLNYLWSATLCLLFCVLLFRNKEYSQQKFILLCLLGFCSGWSHESYAIPLCCGLFLYLIFGNKDGVRVYKNKRFLVPITCCLIGGLFLVLAPGNFVRVKDATTETGSMISLTKIFHGMLSCHILIVFIIAIELGYIFSKKRAIEFIKNNRYALFALAISALFFSPIEISNHRADMGVELLSWILLSRYIIYLKPIRQNAIMTIGVLCGLLFVAVECVLIKEQKTIRTQYDSMVEQMKEKKTPNDLISIKELKGNRFFNYLVYPTEIWNLFKIKLYNDCSAFICEGLPDYSELIKSQSYFLPKGTFYYSSVPLPNHVKIDLEFGDYYLNSPINIVKAIVSRCRKQGNNILTLEAEVKKIEYEGNRYYQIHLPYGKRDREILSVKLHEQ